MDFKYCVLVLIFALWGCGGGSEEAQQDSSCGSGKFRITGMASGINPTHFFGVTLVNKKTNKVTTISSNGVFDLRDPTHADQCFPNNYEYEMELYSFAGGDANQPYTCDLSNKSGVVSGQNITNIVINCSENSSYVSSPDSTPIVSSPPVVQPTQCRDFNIPAMTPNNPPTFSCGPIGNITSFIMADINRFWGSQQAACSCLGDAPLCTRNAVVYDRDFAYTYYDPNFLEELSTRAGTTLAAAWLMSHEAGHHLQRNYNLQYQVGAFKELGADCFSGFFLGNLICENRATEQEVINSLGALCQLDNGQSAWFDPNGHGSCRERVTTIINGINAYSRGLNPVQFCSN